MPNLLRIFALLVLLSVWATAPVSEAARAGNLYGAEVSVTDQSKAQKSAGARRALAQVLVKVTGDRRIAQNPNASALLQRAEEFVQQHRFTPNGTMLVAFNAGAIQQALREERLPVWQQERPAVMIWLVADDGEGQRRIVTGTDSSSLRRNLAEASVARGLPTLWPDQALIDSAGVLPEDIWNTDLEKLVPVSQSRRAEAVLVGRVSKGASGNFYGSWVLVAGGEQSWRGGPATSIHRTTDSLVERLVSTGTTAAASNLIIQVTGLVDARAYAHTVSSLEKLGAVKRVDVVEALEDAVILNLTLNSDAAQFARAVSFNRVLVPVSGSGGDSILQYQYSP